jgi:uncharacterized protein (UPF0179 family)
MIALVDKRCAKEGYEFIYLGTSVECEGCSLHLPCHHNLEKGRNYIVTALKDKNHPCPLFEEVAVCEIQESSIDTAIDPKGAFTGASFMFRHPSCDEVLCNHARYCMPEGLKDGDRCTIEDIKERIKCRKNRELVIATLRRT